MDDQYFYENLRLMEKTLSVKQDYLAGQTVSYRRGRSVEYIMEGSKVKVSGIQQWFRDVYR